jgi:hypothetical protein
VEYVLELLFLLSFWPSLKPLSDSNLVVSTFMLDFIKDGPPLWSSGQSFWRQIQRSQVRFPALPDFLRSSGSGTGSTQPREDN